MSKPTEDAAAAALASEVPLQAVEAASARLPDSPTRTDLVTALGKVRSWWAGNLAAWQGASVSAKAIDTAIQDRDAEIKRLGALNAKLAKDITDLKKSDPVKSWLLLIGIGAIVGGAGVLIASLFVAALSAFPWIRSAAAGSLAFGFLLVTISRFLIQIYWISGAVMIAGLIAGGVWLYTHRTIAKTKANKLAKSVAGSPATI